MLSQIVKIKYENGWYTTIHVLWKTALMRIHSKLLAHSFGVNKVSITSNATIRGIRFIKLGENISAGEGLWLEAISLYQGVDYRPSITIGDNVRMSHYVHIAATHSVQIGSNVLLGSKVLITDHQHGNYSVTHSLPNSPPAQRPLTNNLKTVIGNNVWLGDGVVIMPGVTIGDGSVIGANSVVTRDIPSLTIAVGAPAVSIKTFNYKTMQWEKI